MWDDIIAKLNADLSPFHPDTKPETTRLKLNTLATQAKSGSLTQSSRAALQAGLEAAGIFPRPRIDSTQSSKSTHIVFSRKHYTDHELGFKISTEHRYRGIVLSGLGDVPALADIVPVDRELKDIRKSSKRESKEHPLPGKRIDFVGRRKRHGHKHWVLIEFKLRPSQKLVSQLSGYVERFAQRDDINPADTIEAIVVCQEHDLDLHKQLEQLLGAMGIENDVILRWLSTSFTMAENQPA
jgi:hypothetical protein